MAKKKETTAPEPAEAKAEPAAAAPIKGTNQSGGLAIAALVVGIFAVITAWLAVPGFIAGVVAIVLAVVALRRHQHRGFSIAGLVTGIVGVIGGAISSIFWTLAILVGIGTAAVSHQAVQNAQNQIESYNQQYQAKVNAQKDFAKGETAVFDQYKVKVNSVNNNYQPSDTSSTPGDGKKFISVNVTVTNAGDSTQPVNTYLFSVINGESTISPSYVQGANPLSDNDLAKGASATGDIVFEVPTDAQNLKLGYTSYGYDNGEYKQLDYTLAF